MINFEKMDRDCNIPMDAKCSNTSEVLFVDDVAIGTKGGFTCFIGEAKAKKSFTLIAVAASALSGKKVLNFRVKEKQKVLFLDTEQSKERCIRNKDRILALAGDANADLTVKSVKKYSPEARTEYIRQLVSTKKFGFVFIDGVRDLVTDINNNAEAVSCADNLLRWAEESNCHIVTVLHVNRGDKAARGHLGTEVANKADSLIRVAKIKNSPNDSSEITAESMRDKSFPAFSFFIDKNELPVLDI